MIVSHQRFFFFLFLLSLPFSIRKVFHVYSASGQFNEYLDISLYLSDVFLIVTFILVSIEHKKRSMSMFIQVFHVEQRRRALFKRVPRGTFLTGALFLVLYFFKHLFRFLMRKWDALQCSICSTWNIERFKKLFHVEHSWILLVLAAFIAWNGASVLWSDNRPLAIMSFMRLVEGFLLYLYVVYKLVPRGTSMSNKVFHVEHLSFRNSYASVPRGTIVSRLMFHVEHYRKFLESQCSTWNILRNLFLVTIISGLIQAIIGIAQFALQHSVGLSWLKESFINPQLPGVAKIVIGDDIFIRAYGFMPHPNLLALYLGISLVLLTAYPHIFRKMFHVEHLYRRYIYRTTYATLLFGLIFSFSKAGILASLAGIFSLLYILSKNNVPRGTILDRTTPKLFHVEQFASDPRLSNVPRGTLYSRFMFHVEHVSSDLLNFLRRKLGGQFFSKCSTWNIRILKKLFHVEHFVLLSGLILGILAYSSINNQLFINQSISERLFYINTLSDLIGFRSTHGLGVGQFVWNLQNEYRSIQSWQHQPVHAVYLLIYAESGYIGLALFILFILSVLLYSMRSVPRGTFSQAKTPKLFHVEHNIDKSLQTCLNIIILMLLFLSLFDHYLWDIQQGMLMFWLFVGLLVRVIRERRFSHLR